VTRVLKKNKERRNALHLAARPAGPSPFVDPPRPVVEPIHTVVKKELVEKKFFDFKVSKQSGVRIDLCSPSPVKKARGGESSGAAGSVAPEVPPAGDSIFDDEDALIPFSQEPMDVQSNLDHFSQKPVSPPVSPPASPDVEPVSTEA
jgi:hypothetical protein